MILTIFRNFTYQSFFYFYFIILFSLFISFILSTMGLFSKFSDHFSELGIKKQLLLSFSSSAILALVLVEALCLIFLYAVLRNISSTSTTILTNQISQNLADSVSDSGTLFQDSLRRIAESALLPIIQATGDTYRLDQPLSGESSFFDNSAGIQEAGSVVPSAGQRDAGDPLTLMHSTYMLSNYTGADPPTNLTTDQITAQNNTAHVDHFFIPIYQQNLEVISLYIGTDTLFFRAYPGTGNIREMGPFDATIRPWYTSAKQFTSAGSNHPLYVITDPYKDFTGKGWMVTLSGVITNTATNTEIGVAGIDVLIGTIKSKVEAQSTNSSQTSLYLLSGVALANPTWDLATWDDSRPFRYNDSSNPTISSELWTTITTTTGNGTNSQNYQDPLTLQQYLIVWQLLDLTNGQTGNMPSYASVSAFPLSVIDAPVSSIESQMQETFGVYIGISIAIFLAVLGIVILAVWSLADRISKPILMLKEAADGMSKRIGKADITEETKDDRSGRGINETAVLEDQFYNMVKTIREGFPNSRMRTDNPFFENNEIDIPESTDSNIEDTDSNIEELQRLPPYSR